MQFLTEPNVRIDTSLGLESGQNRIRLISLLLQVFFNRVGFHIVLNLIQIVFRSGLNCKLFLLDIALIASLECRLIMDVH